MFSISLIREMAKIEINIPELLLEDSKKIEAEVDELISKEKKRKLLSLFLDEVMKDAGQLNEEELVKLGRAVKKGRYEKLKARS